MPGNMNAFLQRRVAFFLRDMCGDIGGDLSYQMAVIEERLPCRAERGRA
ncbi:MAG: hypothetical protein AAYR33_02595 [Acetobacteraceae bacterium]